MTLFVTGSLVQWRTGTLSGDKYGIVVSFDQRKHGWTYAITPGAWIHFSTQPKLVWAALCNLEPIVQSGSFG